MVMSGQHPHIPSGSGLDPFLRSRKRRSSPPTDPSSPLSPSSPWSVSSATPTSAIHQPSKRPRHNLANGFSSLSILPRLHRGTSPLPSYEESQASRHQLDDEEEETSFAPGDVRVQEVLSTSPRRRPRCLPNRGSSSSISSVSTDRDACDSDSTFRLPSTTRTAIPQQADTVESDTTYDSMNDVLVEDITPVQGRHRRRREEEMNASVRKRRKANFTDMEVDDVADGGSVVIDADIECMARQKHRKNRTKTRWHEPEKDRIVVTSLGSSSRSGSSERSISPDCDRLLSQPGDQGFTLNPSLLTHLLNAQRKQTSMRQPERGLVLYRSPGAVPWTEVVKAWQGSPTVHLAESRFEELNDDIFVEEAMQRDLTEATPLRRGTEDMDIEMA